VKAAGTGKNKQIGGGKGGCGEVADEELRRSDGNCMGGAKRVKVDGEETEENDEELA
jgi:hypothetical protein